MNARRTALGIAFVLALVGAIVWGARAPGPLPAPLTPTPAPSPPPASAAVTVAVYDDGAPRAGRWVVFHDRDGAVIASSKSDARGRASAAVPAGGAVTVAHGTSVQHLVTVMGVVPGETVVIGEAEDEGGLGRTIATARVRLPGAYTGATRHSVTLGVGHTDVPDLAAPLSMSVLQRFVADGRFRALAEAFGAGGEPLAFAFARASPRPDGGVVDVRLPSWSTRYRSYAVALAHAPAGLARAEAHLGIVGGEHMRFERPSQTLTLSGGETTLRFPVPEPLGGDAAFRLEITWDGAPDRAVLARRGKQEDTRIDLAAELLPRVSGAAVEPGAAADKARPIVRWSIAGDSSKSDATVVRLAWPETREHVWTIVAPPGTAPRLQAPPLPAALASWRPGDGVVTASIAIVESSEYASYDEVRRKGIDAAAEGVEDDADGSLRWSATGELVF